MSRSPKHQGQNANLSQLLTELTLFLNFWYRYTGLPCSKLANCEPKVNYQVFNHLHYLCYYYYFTCCVNYAVWSLCTIFCFERLYNDLDEALRPGMINFTWPVLCSIASLHTCLSPLTGNCHNK